MKLPLPFLLFAIASAVTHGQVIISEISSDNSKYEDEETDTPDWIELHNTGDSAVDLDGWQLTTSESAETAWTIRDLIIEPMAVRLLFASGKDRPGTAEANVTYRPHTSFTLENGGGYLALLDPSQAVADAIQYPSLTKNETFGSKGGTDGYYFPGTPNSINIGNPSPLGLAPSVVFSHEGGLISENIELILSVPDHPEAEIQYALDGGEPSLFSPSYNGPITIDRTQTITARALLPDHLPSRLRSQGFILLDETLTSFSETGQPFESNLPIIVIDTFGINVDNTREFKYAYASVVSPTAENPRPTLGTSDPEYAGLCGIHVRGESSSGFGQKSYALELRETDGDDKDASLLGMPADSDWALYGPWSEKSLIRNKLIFDWMRQLRGADGTSVRAEFCELFLNTARNDDALGNDAYQGIYLLMEKIKRGRNRVPIENLNFETTDSNLIEGGYIIRRDKPDSGKNSWSSSMGQGFQSFDPDRFNPVQLDYIKGYINNFETALRGNDFASPTRGYQKYIDADTFIDAQWFVEISRQVDGYVFSTYWHKDRNGKLRAGPLWDFNISLGNADYATGDKTKGWLYDNANGHGQIYYPNLHKDPEYHLAHWDRYWHIRQSFLSDDAVVAAIDHHVATLLDGYTEPVGNREPESVQNPVARHFRKHPFLGVRQWPNPATSTRSQSWQDEIEFLKDWLLERLDWLDDQSIVVDGKIHRAPAFSISGGVLAQPSDIEIQPYKGTLFNRDRYPQTTIYYTTDGSDPRLPGGDLNPVAQAYTGAISIQETTTIETRILNGETWSPRSSATYLLNHAAASATNLIVSEIMYHPTEPSGLEAFSGFVDSSAFEYIELTNTSTKMVDLSGAHFTRGIVFEFDSLPPHERLIAPGKSILLVKDTAGFERRYRESTTTDIRGQYLGRLNNDGERLTLTNKDNETILDVNYNDGDAWPSEADGQGHSLEWANLSDAQEASAWRSSSEAGGSPGSHLFSINPEIPSNETDSDNDGLSDLVESLLGSDHNDPSSAYHPVLVTLSPSSYQLQQAHSGEFSGSLIVEQSSDLESWTTLDLGPAMGNASLSTWNFTPSDAQPSFLRIRIEP